MAPNLAADRHRLQLASEHIETAANGVNGIVSLLEANKVKFAGGWQGTASTAFGKIYQDFINDCRFVVKKLEKAANDMSVTKKHFDAEEGRQQDEATALSSILNSSSSA